MPFGVDGEPHALADLLSEKDVASVTIFGLLHGCTGRSTALTPLGKVCQPFSADQMA